MADYTPYHVELITPEGPAFEGDAQIVVVPGTAGELGVLAHHAPLVSSLKPGETRITDAKGTVHEFATRDGYIQVRKNQALVLVGEAIPEQRIDVAEARERLQHARAALERAESGDGDLYSARIEATFAEVLVKVSGA
ncbi:MAG: ATP synthase F1 subunit epsilon [Gaiellales bacterium]